MRPNARRKRARRSRIVVATPPALGWELIPPPVSEDGEDAEDEEIMLLLEERAKGNWPPAKK
ncbi:hypothetical protein A2704_05955 [Candidatus Kaiserbacteria bacterium RIFCSPHIGHO2_01_FULL_54_36b]|uniref:Uncharacterized protein n=1 Tax=Candidatus Kaiserbacteria bacterium RIFCSPHIGHO2_01_FULL_54_36b TaxID=1798483 RepID=A0A1F6CP88_9BACT|nr:MAG: hypothetical protein A2704_05955 [Candidatus Kaiserbacteria bacterium RIFCSPHIGHO2_01_FULL_54_36b]